MIGEFAEFARSEFELGAPQDVDGLPLRTHLESEWRQSGVQPAQLADAPPCPQGCEVLWQDFMALHNTRGFGMSAPLRIGFADMDAYQRVNGLSLETWEIAAIRAADGAFMAHWAESRK